MESTQPPDNATATATATSSFSLVGAHNDVTLALAKKESAEHLHGMKELYEIMRQLPLQVKAYSWNNDPKVLRNTSSTSSNIKTIHFVRHGQGFHNLLADQAQAAGRTWTQFCPMDTANNPYIMPELLDAPLTEKGRQQAILLQQKVAELENTKDNNKLQLVVTSPNCRALQTSLLVFEQYLNDDNKSVPFLAHELVREEHGIHVCDKRRSIARQCLEFPQVDFSLIEHDEDLLYRDDTRESKLELGHRIYYFLTWLSQRPEQNIAIVSHSSWLLTLFNGVLDCSSGRSSSNSSNSSRSAENGKESSPLQEWFQTGEMRSVKLEFIMTTTPK